MQLSLHGRRALVCGASQGIGRACAVELAKLGASITAASRDAGKLATAVAALPRAEGQTHDALSLDLSDPESARESLAAHQSRTASAGPYLILINNTGGPPAGSAIDAKSDDLLAAFRSQLIAAHLFAQLLLPNFKAAGFGRIINITSTSVKQPIPNLGISNIVRPAVAAWAKCLATELGGFGVTVNNVLPGYTSTERLASLVKGRAATRGVEASAIEAEIIAATPAGRFGTPEEIASVVAFLASPAAAYINGINVPVDGGRLGTL